MTDLHARLEAVLDASPHLQAFASAAFPDADAGRLLAAAQTVDREIDQTIEALSAAPLDDEAAVMQALRQARQRVALLIALADRVLGASVDQTTARLSRFADAACDAAVCAAFALEGKGGKWKPAGNTVEGFAVLGMGKLGAGELNYSSDIDLIVLYDTATLNALTDERTEAGPFAVRVTRRFVKLMQERTPDGYVFRTDLRLRPDPASTPLALSLVGALNYYESQGRTWERAAMIKARCIAGDVDLGARFIEAIQPFIWRRHLDYAAIDSIRSIKRRINTHKGFGAITVPGHDVKLGRGGIREIEFFAQTQQLIAGGRLPAVRAIKTKPALDALVEAGWIAQAARDDLNTAYDHLRQVEHCVQMIADQQTHRLPQEPKERRAVATLMGETLEAFDARVADTLTLVHQHFSDLFPEHNGAEEIDPFAEELSDALEAHLTSLGYEAPGDVHRLLAGWIRGAMNATATGLARDRLREVGPALLTHFGRTDRPDAALRALDGFLRGLPGGVQFFSMLASNPKIIELLARIMGTAPRLAETLARRPRLFDALLDPRFFGSLPSRDAIRADLERAINQAATYEAKLNASRVVGQEHHFLIGVRLLSQTLTADEAAAAYTALAEETVLSLLDLAWSDVREANGDFPDACLTVLGMGKLGSGELTAASDLDLLLIYDLRAEAAESDGARPLPPSHYFTRVTQRLIAALSAPTAEGVLYELDMRLRPSGKAGPLATSMTAFERYQHTQARTWEHMALTRARAFGRDAAGCDALAGVISGVLTSAKDRAKIRRDVGDMRALLDRQKTGHGPYDFKLVAGGLIDIEFVAQGLQLLSAPERPDVLHHNTTEALRRLGDSGFLEPDDAAALAAAHATYSSLSQITRLCLSGVFDPETAAPSLRRLMTDASDLPSIETLTTHLEHTQADIRQRFNRLFAAAEPDAPRSSLGGDTLEGETQ